MELPSDSPSVPDSVSIDQELNNMGYQNIVIESNILLFLTRAQNWILGNCKRVIADRIKEFLISKNITSALIDLGGNILLLGKNPNGNDFKIGIQKLLPKE
jgi:thiamine biosynthesis lipoprotein